MNIKDYSFFKQVSDVIGEKSAIDEISKIGEDVIVDDSCISGAFDWSSTPQGHSFWSDIECGVSPHVNQ